MLNIGFYKEDMLNLAKEGKPPALVGGKIISCHDVDSCNICYFFESTKSSCTATMIKWLYEEYTPPAPMLTKREHALCEVVGIGWIARDENGALYLFDKKPAKGLTFWKFGGIHIHMDPYFFPAFNFIKWENEEPYSIEEMLGWEVKE